MNFILLLCTIILLTLSIYFYFKNIKLQNSLEKKKKDYEELNTKFIYAGDEALACFWQWNLETDELYLSKGWKSFLGYKEDELDNNFKTFEKLIYPDDFESTMKIVHNYIDGKIDTY